MISAMLLIATVGCVVLGAVSANMGAYLGAGACALVLLLLFGPLTYSVVTYRLIVDPAAPPCRAANGEHSVAAACGRDNRTGKDGRRLRG